MTDFSREDAEQTAAEAIEIPYEALSAQALRGLIEAFVLREGTEYGEKEFSLEQKVSHVALQLKRGEAQVLFDPNSETVDITRVTRGTVG